MRATATYQVSVIGLGRMGAGMARCLLRAGVPVTVWDRKPARVAELVAQGATAAATPAAARGADLLLVSLADWPANETVLFGPDGVLRDGPLPGVLASTSTLAPHEVVTLAAHTGSVLDIGLQGNHEHAASGELRLYVGGHAEVLARIRPVLDVLAQQVRHVGELGAGMRLKLVMNLLMGIEVQAMAEAVALGGSLGLDRRLVLDAITSSGFASPVMAFKARRLASGDFSGPDFRLRLMAKDLQLALAAGDQHQVDLPLVRAAHETHETATGLGLGDQDCAAIIRAFPPAGVPAAGVPAAGVPAADAPAADAPAAGVPAADVPAAATQEAGVAAGGAGS